MSRIMRTAFHNMASFVDFKPIMRKLGKCIMNDERRAAYPHGHHGSVLRSHQRHTVEDSASYPLPYLKPGLSVLDVGCGPGTITADLAARVAPGLVTAVDQFDDALTEA